MSEPLKLSTRRALLSFFAASPVLYAASRAMGRPYLWGLGSFGQEGVETVLDILKRELEIVMRQAGTVRISEINRSFINRV